MTATMSITTPIELMAAQVDCEILTLPTGAKIFSRRERASRAHGGNRNHNHPQIHEPHHR